MWLVEVGYFPRIRLIFLIKGHTKNACDCLFNLLKLTYHKLNVYRYNQLLEVINSNEFITAHKMDLCDMYNFSKWQDRYYRQPQGGEFNSTHIFELSGTSYGSKPALLKKWDYDGAKLRTDSLLPTQRNRKCQFMSPAMRKVAISNMSNELDELTAPGLRDIKSVELYTKWRPLLPESARDSTCPKPSDLVMKKVKLAKSAKRKEKKRKLAEEGDGDVVYDAADV